MTAATETEFAFRRGGAQAEERYEAEAAARAASRSKVEYLSSLLKKSGDSVIIRWITDDPQMPEVVQHGFVPTKAAPADKPADKGWPESLPAICRYTRNKDDVPFFNDCYVCDAKLKDTRGKVVSRGTRMWGLACVRKEVIGTQEMVDAGRIQPHQINTRVGLTDDVVEYDEVKDGQVTGVKLKKKRIVVVNFAIQNFFSQFITFNKFHKTLLDRDYAIVRKGEIPKVDYKAVPLEVINKPLFNEAGEVIGSEPFDLRNPKYAELYADHGINLGKIMSRMMSEEYFNRYFDPRVVVSWKSGSGDDDDEDAAAGAASSSEPAASSPVAEPTDGVTKEKLASMRDKIMQNSKAAAPAAEQAAEATPEAAPAAAAEQAPATEPAAAAPPAAASSAPSTSPLMDFS